jgi:hypothetical protein
MTVPAKPVRFRQIQPLESALQVNAAERISSGSASLKILAMVVEK